jgi:hypothetical protein
LSLFLIGDIHGRIPEYLKPLDRTVLVVPLSGVGGSDHFPFHLVFLPTASLLCGEGFSVVVVVAWIMAIECGLVNLLPYPSLP